MRNIYALQRARFGSVWIAVVHGSALDDRSAHLQAVKCSTIFSLLRAGEGGRHYEFSSRPSSPVEVTPNVLRALRVSPGQTKRKANSPLVCPLVLSTAFVSIAHAHPHPFMRAATAAD